MNRRQKNVLIQGRERKVETKIFQADILDAARLIQQGKLVAFPTETVYGLGANALNEEAVKQVYQVKGRPSDNPLIVHVSSFEMVEQYAEDIPTLMKPLVEAFWPGPLTLIVKGKNGVFPDCVTGGLATVAFRMPDNQKTLQLISQAGVPLVGPSANTSGKPSPTTAAHVYHDLKGKIAGILDDGATQIGVESTVLDLTSEDNIPMILRPGAVTRNDLEKVVGTVAIDQHLIKENEAPKAPGMKYKHYAPDTPVLIVEGSKEQWKEAISWATNNKKKTGIYASQEIVDFLGTNDFIAVSFGENTVENATRFLFAGLRELDGKNVDIIFAQAFPEELLGAAYMNRLKKAANQNFFKS